MKAVLPQYALTCCLSFCAISTVVSAPVCAQNQSSNQIIIYASESNDLNQSLTDALQNTEPDASVKLLQGTGQPDLSVMIQTGSVDDSSAIQKARWILQPQWTWSKIELSGPHSDGQNWNIRAESELNLELSIFPMQQGSPGERHILRRNWRIHKDIPIRNIQQLLAVVKEATGLEADLYNDNHRELVLEVVRQIPAFKELLALEANLYLGDLAEAKIRQSDFYDFVKKWESYQQPNQPTASSSPTQPSQPSDKMGINIALRGGTLPLWLNGPSQLYQPQPESFFTPHFHLDLEYELKSLLNLENTFLVFSGGANLPVHQSFFDLNQPPATPGIPADPQSSALGINGELGLSYKLDFGSWLLHMGVRGGIIGGFLMSQFASPTGSPSTVSFGGSALLGAQWKMGTDFLIGMDTGFRYYTNGNWTIAPTGFPQPVAFPPLTSWGPILQAYISYRL